MARGGLRRALFARSPSSPRSATRARTSSTSSATSPPRTSRASSRCWWPTATPTTGRPSGCAPPPGPPGSSCGCIDNPAGWVSHGLNACIREARGDLIVRLDCHSRYASGLPAPLRGAVRADGRVERRRHGSSRPERPRWSAPWPARWTARSAASAGRAAAGGGPVETDTVTFGAFRPEAFEHAGRGRHLRGRATRR